MAALVCDLCGGKLVMGASGIAVCDSCGMEHSADRMKEKVQEIKGTVRVDNTHMITTYLEMTATALEAGNNEEAENYANKVIEIDPRSAKAWFYKGKAVGWQTTGRNNRYPESIANWINAYSFSSLEEREELVDDIKAEARKIGAAILQLECNSFADFRSDDNKEDVTNALDMIEEQLELLKEKTEIDVYTDAFKVILASTVNAGAVNASDNADQDFGPENINRDKYSWNRYTEAQDWCWTRHIACAPMMTYVIRFAKTILQLRKRFEILVRINSNQALIVMAPMLEITHSHNPQKNIEPIQLTSGRKREITTTQSFESQIVKKQLTCTYYLVVKQIESWQLSSTGMLTQAKR